MRGIDRLSAAKGVFPSDAFGEKEEEVHSMSRNERHNDFLKNAWNQCTANCAEYFSSTYNLHYSMKDRIDNIDLYGSTFTSSPHRYIGRDSLTAEGGINLSQNISPLQDNLGDIYLKYSHYNLIAYLKSVRQEILAMVNGDEASVLALPESFKDSIDSLLSIWKFRINSEFDYSTITYTDHLEHPLNEDDRITIQPVYSVMIYHELGHLYYNLYNGRIIKDIPEYLLEDSGINEKRRVFEQIVEDNHMGSLCPDKYEEYFADNFSYMNCSRLLGGLSRIEPFYLSLYGIIMNLVILEIKNYYLGIDKSDSHPTSRERIEFIYGYIKVVNTGRFPDYFRNSGRICRAGMDIVSLVRDHLRRNYV